MIDITVGQVVESPVKRLLRIIGNTVERKIQAYYGMTGLADVILHNVQEAKTEYLNYKDYFTH